ncbi:unnamed protein product [Peronospora destructor]|uniref:BZIP domain-containing protein n=1 Tax=Peronospora destructor TaxID=86335 RepID=A0AAV0V4H7_9STRA|nr:unnamed protein product [Peronospora destructor]
MCPMDLAGDATGTKKQEMDENQRTKNHRLIVKRCYYKKLLRQLCIGGGSAVHRAYIQLAQLKSALIKENAELKRLEADHVTMEKQVAQLAAAQGKAAAAVRQAQEVKRVNPMLIVNPLSLEQLLH